MVRDQTVAVVDDEPFFRLGLRALVEARGSEVVLDTAYGHEVVRGLASAPAAIVLVATPADMPRVELARRLQDVEPRPAVVVFLPRLDHDELGALVALDPDAIVPRSLTPEALGVAVERALGGEHFVDAAFMDPVPVPGDASVDVTPLALTLTARERDVLVLLSEGRSNRDIAATLFVSLPTVKTHLAHIYGKLDASNRNEALGRAFALGLLA